VGIKVGPQIPRVRDNGLRKQQRLSLKQCSALSDGNCRLFFSGTVLHCRQGDHAFMTSHT
jgi:hypothetical protein